MKTVAVEIAGPRNQCVYFAPLRMRIRGALDVRKIAEPNGMKLHQEWGEGIPGQRIEYYPESGEGAIIEPLHDSEFAALREKIEAKGFKLPEQRQPFRCDVATAIHHLRAIVEGGAGRLVAGEFPEVEGTPETRFHSSQRPGPMDRLAAALERQAELQEKTLEALLKLAAKK